MKNFEVIKFETGDLSKYTSSMFCPDECPVYFEAKDDDGNTVTIAIEVAGEVEIEYDGEFYSCVYDLPDEIQAMFEDGSAYESKDIDIINNNWFEEVYTVTDSKGNEIACDGDVFVSYLPDYTPESLKAELLEEAEWIINHYVSERDDR